MSRKALIIIKLAAVYIVLVTWFLLASIVSMDTLIHQHQSDSTKSNTHQLGAYGGVRVHDYRDSFLVRRLRA